MARKTSRSQQVDIFNFSFLDIIACTVGALIFVLVMFMLHASHEAVEAASPKREKEIIASIADIEKAKNELKILEDKHSAARNQAEKMGLGMDITSEKLKAEKESTKNEIVRLTSQVKELEQKASQAKNAPVGIWIEVLPPREGAERKPHLVECRSDGIYIFEERISESLERTKDPSSRWNALRARVDESPADEFILFLVRPTGVGTFRELHSQLKRLKTPQGYEPILSHWRIMGLAE